MIVNGIYVPVWMAILALALMLTGLWFCLDLLLDTATGLRDRLADRRASRPDDDYACESCGSSVWAQEIDSWPADVRDCWNEKGLCAACQLDDETTLASEIMTRIASEARQVIDSGSPAGAWTRESRELVMPPWWRDAADISLRGSGAVVESMFTRVQAGLVRQLEETAMDAGSRPCEACGGNRWKTLIKGEGWLCRACGLMRAADGSRGQAVAVAGVERR